MTTMASGLIQMNAHMIVSREAKAMIIIGVIAAVVFTVLAILSGIGRNKSMKYAAFFAVVAIMGVVMIVTGANRPRQKVIMCCADGPISLEQVATIYDIQSVDGKLITLIER